MDTFKAMIITVGIILALCVGLPLAFFLLPLLLVGALGFIIFFVVRSIIRFNNDTSHAE